MAVGKRARQVGMSFWNAFQKCRKHGVFGSGKRIFARFYRKVVPYSHETVEHLIVKSALAKILMDKKKDFATGTALGKGHADVIDIDGMVVYKILERGEPAPASRRMTAIDIGEMPDEAAKGILTLVEWLKTKLK